MAFAPRMALWVGLAAGVACAGVPPAQADPASSVSGAESREQARAVSPLSAKSRAAIDRVIGRPTVTARGPCQTFKGDPALYAWLLDHPAQGVRMWRLLGAQCLDIRELGGSRFSWSDGDGSEIHWQTAVATDSIRVWYAEGNVKAATFLPAVPVRAVVILRHTLEPTEHGTALISHRAELYFQTDSKAAAAVTRLLGQSAPHLAEQCVVQLETFFSALVWYAYTHPQSDAGASVPERGAATPFILPPRRGEP